MQWPSRLIIGMRRTPAVGERVGIHTEMSEEDRPGGLSHFQFTGKVDAFAVAPLMVSEIGTVPAEIPAGTIAFT
jgi:hypothetical protein